MHENKALPKDGKIFTDEGILYLTPEDSEFLTDLINTTLIENFSDVLVEGEIIPKTEKSLERLKMIASVELLSLLEKFNPELRKKLLALPVEKRKEIAYKIIKGCKGMKGIFYIFYNEDITPHTGEYELYEYIPLILEKELMELEKIVQNELKGRLFFLFSLLPAFTPTGTTTSILSFLIFTAVREASTILVPSGKMEPTG